MSSAFPFSSIDDKFTQHITSHDPNIKISKPHIVVKFISTSHLLYETVLSLPGYIKNLFHLNPLFSSSPSDKSFDLHVDTLSQRRIIIETKINIHCIFILNRKNTVKAQEISVIHIII